jgi:hypothetical protein
MVSTSTGAYRHTMVSSLVFPIAAALTLNPAASPLSAIHAINYAQNPWKRPMK